MNEPSTEQSIAVISAIVENIEKIPATFWGVLIGSLFTLTGIYFTNRAQAKRQRQDLNHDRAERKSDREFAARKEIFMEAAGGLYGQTQAIGKLSNFDIPFSQISAESTKNSAPVARAYIIASDETVRAIARLGAGAQATLIRLSPLRHEIDALKQRASVLEARQQRYMETADRMIAVARQYSVEGVLDERRLNAANSIREFEEREAGKVAAERDELTSQTYPKEIELAKQAVAGVRELWPDIVAALAAMRGELGLPTDQSVLLEIIREAAGRPMEEFDKLMERYSRMIEARAESKDN